MRDGLKLTSQVAQTSRPPASREIAVCGMLLRIGAFAIAHALVAAGIVQFRILYGLRWPGVAVKFHTFIGFLPFLFMVGSALLANGVAGLRMRPIIPLQEYVDIERLIGGRFRTLYGSLPDPTVFISRTSYSINAWGRSHVFFPLYDMARRDYELCHELAHVEHGDPVLRSLTPYIFVFASAGFFLLTACAILSRNVPAPSALSATIENDHALSGLMWGYYVVGFAFCWLILALSNALSEVAADLVAEHCVVSPTPSTLCRIERPWLQRWLLGRLAAGSTHPALARDAMFLMVSAVFAVSRTYISSLSDTGYDKNTRSGAWGRLAPYLTLDGIGRPPDLGSLFDLPPWLVEGAASLNTNIQFDVQTALSGALLGAVAVLVGTHRIRAVARAALMLAVAWGCSLGINSLNRHLHDLWVLPWWEHINSSLTLPELRGDAKVLCLATVLALLVPLARKGRLQHSPLRTLVVAWALVCGAMVLGAAPFWSRQTPVLAALVPAGCLTLLVLMIRASSLKVAFLGVFGLGSLTTAVVVFGLGVPATVTTVRLDPRVLLQMDRLNACPSLDNRVAASERSSLLGNIHVASFLQYMVLLLARLRPYEPSPSGTEIGRAFSATQAVLWSPGGVSWPSSSPSVVPYARVCLVEWGAACAAPLLLGTIHEAQPIWFPLSGSGKVHTERLLELARSGQLRSSSAPATQGILPDLVNECHRKETVPILPGLRTRFAATPELRSAVRAAWGAPTDVGECSAPTAVSATCASDAVIACERWAACLVNASLLAGGAECTPRVDHCETILESHIARHALVAIGLRTAWWSASERDRYLPLAQAAQADPGMILPAALRAMAPPGFRNGGDVQASSLALRAWSPRFVLQDYHELEEALAVVGPARATDFSSMIEGANLGAQWCRESTSRPPRPDHVLFNRASPRDRQSAFAWLWLRLWTRAGRCGG